MGAVVLKYDGAIFSQNGHGALYHEKHVCHRSYSVAQCDRYATFRFSRIWGDDSLFLVFLLSQQPSSGSQGLPTMGHKGTGRKTLFYERYDGDVGLHERVKNMVPFVFRDNVGSKFAGM